MAGHNLKMKKTMQTYVPEIQTRLIEFKREVICRAGGRRSQTA